MHKPKLSRRSLLRSIPAVAGTAYLALQAPSDLEAQGFPSDNLPKNATQKEQDRTRAARMQWWHKAHFGMFVHCGVYSAIARKEWVLLEEAMPLVEYEAFVPHYQPSSEAIKEWVRLAKDTGMEYMVFTAKHHEGYCNFDTKLTPYNSVQSGPRRDLVREYVEAARAQGLRVGLYYSLMDWHHQDGALCAHNEDARKRFVAYTHGLIRELLTNYGKIDVLWYDIPTPLNAAGWESQRMNDMVFALQPEIIVNDRNKLPGDYTTPEQNIGDSSNPRSWESCMTINESWGYQRADNDWKDSKRLLRNLLECSAGGGNYLLNIGPLADGSVPAPSLKVLQEMGSWIGANRESVFDTDVCQISDPIYASYTQKNNTLYMHIHYWPGSYVAMAGLTTSVVSVRYLASGKAVRFEQKDLRLRLLDLPESAPAWPITTFAIECSAKPSQNEQLVTDRRIRLSV